MVIISTENGAIEEALHPAFPWDGDIAGEDPGLTKEIRVKVIVLEDMVTS